MFHTNKIYQNSLYTEKKEIPSLQRDMSYRERDKSDFLNHILLKNNTTFNNNNYNDSQLLNNYSQQNYKQTAIDATLHAEPTFPHTDSISLHSDQMSSDALLSSLSSHLNERLYATNRQFHFTIQHSSIGTISVMANDYPNRLHLLIRINDKNIHNKLIKSKKIIENSIENNLGKKVDIEFE